MFCLYPYKRRTLKEVLEMGMVNVLSGSCVGRSNYPVIVKNFLSSLEKNKLSLIPEKMLYWFSDIVSEVIGFDISGDEDVSFKITVRLADGSVVEVIK